MEDTNKPPHHLSVPADAGATPQARPQEARPPRAAPPSSSSSSAEIPKAVAPASGATPQARPQEARPPRAAPPGKRKRKPKLTEIDPEQLRRGQAEAQARAQALANERQRHVEEIERIEKARAKAEQARKREQTKLARAAARQQAHLRKRLAGLGAEVLEELQATNENRQLWAQFQQRVKLKAGPRVDALFAELRKLQTLQETLKP